MIDIAMVRMLEERDAEIERLRAACKLFTESARDAVRALNAAGIACPASIAFAAEKARAALEQKP